MAMATCAGFLRTGLKVEKTLELDDFFASSSSDEEDRIEVQPLKPVGGHQRWLPKIQFQDWPEDEEDDDDEDEGENDNYEVIDATNLSFSRDMELATPSSTKTRRLSVKESTIGHKRKMDTSSTLLQSPSVQRPTQITDSNTDDYTYQSENFQPNQQLDDANYSIIQDIETPSKTVDFTRKLSVSRKVSFARASSKPSLQTLEREKVSTEHVTTKSPLALDTAVVQRVVTPSSKGEQRFPSALKKAKRKGTVQNEDVVSDPEDAMFKEDEQVENYCSEPEINTTKSHKRRRSAVKVRQQRRAELEVKILSNGGLKDVELDNGTCVRRSNRMRFKPLEYWRNERVKYGRRKSGPFPVPVIHDVIRVPETSSTEKTRQHSKLAKVKGIRKEIQSKSKVSLNVPGSEQKQLHNVFAPLSEYQDLKQVADSTYFLARGLTDPFNSAAYSGSIVLPKDAQKPLRNSGDVTIFGTITSGELEVTIQDSKVTLARGCSFCVPRGNDYAFSNKSSRECRVFFVNIRQKPESF